MAEKYFMLETKEQETNIVIYGDITSWEWLESDVSSYSLAKAIEGITSPVINVYINSYGGEVAEGVAIYRQLKRHAAQVRTYCDGFACSAASVVFMAGNERIVYPTSMLMIHNALYDHVSGNAAELRKHADTIEAISQTAANAYMDVVTIDREALDALLANETWIPPQMALDMGFATQIAEETTPSAKASLSARKSVFQMICGAQKAKDFFGTNTGCPSLPPYSAGGAISQKKPIVQTDAIMQDAENVPIMPNKNSCVATTSGDPPPDAVQKQHLMRFLSAAIGANTSKHSQ